MPSLRPTLSTWIAWPSPTSKCSEVSGANRSALAGAGTSAAMDVVRVRLQRAAFEVAIDEAVAALSGFRLGHFEDFGVNRRQRAGGVGIPGIAGQRERLA